MHTSINRRMLGILSVVLASQLLSACVVLPVPVRRGSVMIEGGGHGHGHGHRHHPHWRR